MFLWDWGAASFGNVSGAKGRALGLWLVACWSRNVILSACVMFGVAVMFGIWGLGALRVRVDLRDKIADLAILGLSSLFSCICLDMLRKVPMVCLSQVLIGAFWRLLLC